MADGEARLPHSAVVLFELGLPVWWQQGWIEAISPPLIKELAAHHRGVNIQTATHATMRRSLDIHARAGITFVASGTRRLSSVSEEFLIGNSVKTRKGTSTHRWMNGWTTVEITKIRRGGAHC